MRRRHLLSRTLVAGGQHTPATTSITQPPVLALIAPHPLQTARDTASAETRLRAIPGSLVAYHRWWFTTRDPHDSDHVDSSRRPRQEQYDRYLYLLDFCREQVFDTEKIYAACP